MQQPSATIANLDGSRTDDRRVPQHRGQASQPHRPAWWIPGEGRGNGPPPGGNRSGGLPPRQNRDSSYD
eukprot:2778780-Pleurochrysis_carterae.AAC.1